MYSVFSGSVLMPQWIVRVHLESLGLLTTKILCTSRSANRTNASERRIMALDRATVNATVTGPIDRSAGLSS